MNFRYPSSLSAVFLDSNLVWLTILIVDKIFIKVTQFNKFFLSLQYTQIDEGYFWAHMKQFNQLSSIKCYKQKCFVSFVYIVNTNVPKHLYSEEKWQNLYDKNMLLKNFISTFL